MLRDRILSPKAIQMFAESRPTKGLHVRMAATGAEVWLYEEIGTFGVTASAFASALREAGNGPIDLHINSPGGDAFDGFAMYEAIRKRGGVTAYVDALAASAATIVMLGAERIVAAERAMLMIHNSRGLAYGDEQELRDFADLLTKLDGNAADAYAAKTGKDLEELRAAMAAETWFTASEALDFALVDEIAKGAPPAMKLMAAPDEIAKRREMLAALRAASAT